MATSLKDRIDSYQELSNYKLLGKLPVVIYLNGRSFSKSTSLLEKPFCAKFAECLYSTMLKVSSDIDGAIFAYSHNDEITLILRNDLTPDMQQWCDNKLYKIHSIVSSMATLHFNNCANTIGLNISNEPIFISHAFTVPNLQEAVNTIVSRQQQNFHTSIQFACFYEMIKKYDKPTIKEMLAGLSIDEKIQLLKQECDVDYYQLPQSFRRGVAAYKIPKLIDGIMKNKWTLNYNLPIFTKNQEFISNLLKTGHDIFRV